MAKNNKRKEQLAKKSKFESFVFQVGFDCKKRGMQMNLDDPSLQAELAFVKELDMVDGFMKLKELLERIKRELGVVPVEDCPQLTGATLPYLMGITSTAPTEGKSLTSLANTEQQLTFRFTTDDRIRIVEWLKENPIDGITLTTRLGQPMLRLPGFNIELKRVVPAFNFGKQ